MGKQLLNQGDVLSFLRLILRKEFGITNQKELYQIKYPLACILKNNSQREKLNKEEEEEEEEVEEVEEEEILICNLPTFQTSISFFLLFFLLVVFKYNMNQYIFKIQ